MVGGACISASSTCAAKTVERSSTLTAKWLMNWLATKFAMVLAVFALILNWWSAAAPATAYQGYRSEESYGSNEKYKLLQLREPINMLRQVKQGYYKKAVGHFGNYGVEMLFDTGSDRNVASKIPADPESVAPEKTNRC